MQENFRGALSDLLEQRKKLVALVESESVEWRGELWASLITSIDNALEQTGTLENIHLENIGE